MKGSGWAWVPAAFLFLLNFAASGNKYLFAYRGVFFLFLVFLFFFLRHFDLDRLLRPLTAGISLIVFAYGILQKWLLFPIYLRQLPAADSLYSQALIARIRGGRIFSLFPLPTLHAAVCALLLVFIIHYLRQAGVKWKTLWLLLAVMGTLNLLLAQSFGAVLYLAAALLFYFFRSGVIRVRYVAPVLMALSLVFFLVTALRFAEARELEPAKLRLTNWQQALRLIGEAPVWGVGLGNYEIEIPPHIRPGEASSIYAHNFVLQLAAETGLPLFLLLLFGVAWSLRGQIKMLLRPEAVLYAAALILIILNGLVDIGPYFFSLGLALALCLSQALRIPASAGAGAPRHRRWQVVVLALLAILLALHEWAESARIKGDFSASQGRFAQAETEYRRSLARNPFGYRAEMGLAVCAFQQGQSGRAADRLERVLRVFPHYANASFLLSRIEVGRQRYLSALYLAERACRDNTKSGLYRKWYDSIASAFPGKIPAAGN